MPTSPNPPLRILHLTAGSDAGGVSRYLFDLCEAMHARGHDVAIAGERGASHDLFQGAPWPWIDAPLKGGPWALLRAARRLRGWLDEHPVDVVHCHYRKPVLVARRLQRHARPDRGRAPILYTLHLTHLGLGPIARLLTDFGDHTHAPSADGRDWLVRSARVPAERVTVIPHGVRVDRFPPADDRDRAAARRALGLPEGVPIVAYVGRFDTPKNEDWLLDVGAAAPDAHVVLQGEGPNGLALRSRVERVGLHGRVALLPYGDPLPVYRACDLLALPSAREGFSLVCAEAMAVGRAVVRTRTAGAAELIVEGVTGVSTPVERDAFVAAAAALLRDPARLRTMGGAASRHIEHTLRFCTQVDRTTDLYRLLVASARA